jgi:hypothetical protein
MSGDFHSFEDALNDPDAFKVMDWNKHYKQYKEHPDNVNEMNREDPPRNIGAKYDSGKEIFGCFMIGLAPVIRGVVAVLTYGAKKYKRDSWQTVPNAKQRYTDAFYRHMNAYHNGEEIDEESGLAHILHATCNMMFICWFEIQEHYSQTKK